MAIKKTRQRQRGGPYSKFDKTKTLPREFQIVESGDPNSKDGRAVYIAFEAGEPKRLSTYEDMQEDIDNATEEIQGTLTAGVDKKIKEADAAITSAKSAATKANTATTNANTATDSANKAADNANKAVENIQSKVGINDRQPSDVTTYSGNKIENKFSSLAAGSGNLLRGTKSFDSIPGYVQYSSSAKKSGEDKNGFGILDISGNGSWNGVAMGTDIEPSENALAGKWCVISFDAKSKVLKTQKKYYCIVIAVFGKNGDEQKLIRTKNQNTYYFDSKEFNNDDFVDGQWVRVSFLVKITDTSEWKVDSSTSYAQYKYGFQILTTNVNNDEPIQIKKLKMEISNIPSSWSPNEYDITKEYVKKSDVVNNFTTNTAGYVADARAIKQLNDDFSAKYNALNSTLVALKGYFKNEAVDAKTFSDDVLNLYKKTDCMLVPFRTKFSKDLSPTKTENWFRGYVVFQNNNYNYGEIGNIVAHSSAGSYSGLIKTNSGNNPIIVWKLLTAY